MPSPTDPVLTFLGTGTSVGVPVIGCDCDVCLSGDPRNTRTRSSITVEVDGLKILVDSGPDLREQALRENLRSIDAIIYTHAHVDHVAGFDELRAFCWHRDTPLPLYATPDCLLSLQTMYGWAFSEKQVYKGYVQVQPHPVGGNFQIGPVSLTPLPVLHGRVTTIGYRFDLPTGYSVAYIPDVKSVPDGTFPLLKDLDPLIIDSLGQQTHPTHLSTDESIAISRRCGAKQTYLTHTGHGIDLRTATLPESFHYATDGLKLRLSS